MPESHSTRKCKCGANSLMTPSMAKKRDYRCRECLRAAQNKHAERRPEYNRRYREKNPEKYKRQKRESTERNPETHRRWVAANRQKVNEKSYTWDRKNTEKKRANRRVWYALKHGYLVKGPCEACGCEKVQAHHDDYSKPLVVRWFCTKCHKQKDRERQEKERKCNENGG